MADEKKTLHDSQFLNPSQILREIHLENSMQIADFGAGSGYMSFEAAKLIGRQGLVYALDVKKTVIEHLKNEIQHRQIENIKPIWTDLELVNHNPIPPKTIDLILIVNMLFQSNKHQQVLEEACRELKPGGRIVVIDWVKQATPFGPPLDDRIDLEKFKQIAYNLGLNKIKEFTAGHYHFGLILKK